MAEPDFIETFRRIMYRPERYEAPDSRYTSGRLRVPLIVGVLLLAVLPLVAPLVIGPLFQSASNDGVAANPVTGAAVDALKDFDERFKGWTPAENNSEAWRLRSAQRARDALIELSGGVTEARNTKKQIAAHKKFRAKALLVAGAALLGAFGFGLMLAQYQLLSRHWGSFWPLKQDQEATKRIRAFWPWAACVSILAAAVFVGVANVNQWSLLVGFVLALGLMALATRSLSDKIYLPRSITIVASFAAFGISTLVVNLIDLPGGLRDTFSMLSSLALMAVVFLMTLYGVVFALAGYTALTFARNFPNVIDVGDLWIDWDTDHALRAAEDPGTLWRLLAKRPLPDGDPLRVGRSLSAKDSVAMVDTIVATLAIFLVLSLVVLTLGFEVLLLTSSLGGEDLVAAARKSTEAIVFGVGASSSISLAAIYALSVARLRPYKEALEDLEAAAQGEADTPPKALSVTQLSPSRLTVTGGAETVTVTGQGLSHDRADRDKEAEAQLARYIGADEEKFVSILEGGNYGAGFHEVVKARLQDRIVQVATLLAPTAAAALLNLLQ